MGRKIEALIEEVIVIPVNLFKKFGYFQGLSFEIDKYLKQFSKSENYELLDRTHAESNFDFKQLVIFAILRYRNKIVVFEQEDELGHMKYSLAIGGHISKRDLGGSHPFYYEALRREINEEMKIKGGYTPKIVAIINDDIDEGGKLHLGIVFNVLLNRKKLKSKQDLIKMIKFMTPSELKKNLDLFENWGRICIEKMENLIP